MVQDCALAISYQGLDSMFDDMMDEYTKKY